MVEKGHIAFTGGEPFLYHDWDEILRHVNGKTNLQFTVNTNGTIFRPDLIRAISKTSNFAGFIISLESSKSEVHDLLRPSKKESSFERTIQFCAYLVSQDVPFSINTTICRDNFHTMRETADFAKRLGAKFISMARVYPLGKAAANNEIEFEEFRRVAEEITRVYPSDGNFSAFIEDDCQRFFFDRNYRLDLFSNLSTYVKDRKWRGCAAGKTMLHIKVDGEVLACAFLDKSIGSIFSHSMQDLWLNSPLLAELRDLKHLSGICSACFLRTVCIGCRSRAIAASGNVMGEDPLCPGPAYAKKLYENHY
jgi:radical SAM protein with 4Fe4S-binding SPASM domain